MLLRNERTDVQLAEVALTATIVYIATQFSYSMNAMDAGRESGQRDHTAGYAVAVFITGVGMLVSLLAIQREHRVARVIIALGNGMAAALVLPMFIAQVVRVSPIDILLAGVPLALIGWVLVLLAISERTPGMLVEPPVGASEATRNPGSPE